MDVLATRITSFNKITQKNLKSSANLTWNSIYDVKKIAHTQTVPDMNGEDKNPNTALNLTTGVTQEIDIELTEINNVASRLH